MCYYKLHIFMHCGHSALSDLPVGFCKAAKDPSDEAGVLQQQKGLTTFNVTSIHSRTDSLDIENRKDPGCVPPNRKIQSCTKGQIHPLQSRRLDRLCTVCQYERDQRLQNLESLGSAIHFEPWQWRFKYQGGTDLMQQKDPLEEASGTGNDSTVTTTLRRFVTSNSGWMREWVRQKDHAVN